MVTLKTVFDDVINLSQAASELSWQFLLDSEGKLTQSETQIAASALGLCEAVKATEMLATGQDSYDLPSFQNMPSSTRRLLQIEKRNRDFNPARFKVISTYTCKYENILNESASGARKLSTVEIELLRKHFAGVASTLLDMDL